MLSANVKGDLYLGIPIADGKDVVFGNDIQLVAEYSGIELDAYYASQASPKKDKDDPIASLLSA